MSSEDINSFEPTPLDKYRQGAKSLGDFLVHIGTMQAILTGLALFSDRPDIIVCVGIMSLAFLTLGTFVRRGQVWALQAVAAIAGVTLLVELVWIVVAGSITLNLFGIAICGGAFYDSVRNIRLHRQARVAGLLEDYQG